MNHTRRRLPGTAVAVITKAGPSGLTGESWSPEAAFRPMSEASCGLVSR